MQDDEPLDTDDMVGNLNNLDVFECSGGKRGIIGSISSAPACTMVCDESRDDLAESVHAHGCAVFTHRDTLRGTRFAMDIIWIISVSNDV